MAVGATGVDTSEWGDGVSAGVSLGVGVAPTGLLGVAMDGVQLSSATTRDPAPLVRAEIPAQAPRHMSSSTNKNASAEPLFCIEAIVLLDIQSVAAAGP